jgi:hypothetical protein
MAAGDTRGQLDGSSTEPLTLTSDKSHRACCGRGRTTAVPWDMSLPAPSQGAAGRQASRSSSSQPIASALQPKLTRAHVYVQQRYADEDGKEGCTDRCVSLVQVCSSCCPTVGGASPAAAAASPINHKMPAHSCKMTVRCSLLTCQAAYQH